MKRLILLIPAFVLHAANVNAGVEAEMKIAAMAPAAMLWAKACNENNILCGQAGVFTAGDAKVLATPVGFAPTGAGLQVCGEKQVTLAHEDLYVDGVKPKSDIELAQIMVQQMLYCGGWKRFRLRRLNFDQLLPVARKLKDLPFAVLTGRNTDVIVALESPLNAQEMLTQAMSCTQVRIGSAETNGFHVQCLDDNKEFLVMVRQDPAGFRFVRKLSGDDRD